MPAISKIQNNIMTYLILSVCLIVPFSNDEYIPSLPDIAWSLMTTHAQWVMSIFLLGLSLSQLFYGPLLDRYGRKPVLMTGLGIFIIGSFFTVIANSLPMLLFGRLIQAIGACSGIVSVLAIVRDSYPPKEIVKMTSFIMAIIAICPTLAPIVGNLLQIVGSWRACFALLLVMGIFYAFLIGFFLQETQQEKNMHALNLSQLIINYTSLLKNKQFLGFVLTSCFSYASIFCYFAVAPFLLLDLLHLPVGSIGIIIAINAIPLLVASYLIAKIFGEINLSKAVLIGSIFIFAGGVVMVITNLLIKPSLLGLMIPTFISSIGVGIIRPSASAGAIRIADKKIAGSAAAMFSFFSFIGSAVFTSLTAKFSYHSLLPFALLLSVLGIAALFSAILVRQQSRLREITSFYTTVTKS
jgi:Bcr/CflA subfamily drug resistance transporter